MTKMPKTGTLKNDKNIKKKMRGRKFEVIRFVSDDNAICKIDGLEGKYSVYAWQIEGIRKILFTDGMSNDMMLFLTDAPVEVLEELCKKLNLAGEDGKGYTPDELLSEWYVKMLFDSEADIIDRDEIEEGGYDEAYDLSTFAMENPLKDSLIQFIEEKMELFGNTDVSIKNIRLEKNLYWTARVDLSYTWHLNSWEKGVAHMDTLFIYMDGEWHSSIF